MAARHAAGLWVVYIYQDTFSTLHMRRNNSPFFRQQSSQAEMIFSKKKEVPCRHGRLYLLPIIVNVVHSRHRSPPVTWVASERTKTGTFKSLPCMMEKQQGLCLKRVCPLCCTSSASPAHGPSRMKISSRAQIASKRCMPSRVKPCAITLCTKPSAAPHR